MWNGFSDDLFIKTHPNTSTTEEVGVAQGESTLTKIEAQVLKHISRMLMCHVG